MMCQKKTARILIADDDPLVTRTVSERLRTEGYEVFIASNGREALLQAMEERPDLIVLDVLLPYLTGLQVLDAIRHDAQLRATPVVLLSVLSSPESVARATLADPDVYLTKPQDRHTYCFDPHQLDSLVVVVRRLLKTSRDALSAKTLADNEPILAEKV
jgi:CheY-like chemotaxis protein